MSVIFHLFVLILILCAGCTSSYEPSSGKEGYNEIFSFGAKMHHEKDWNLISIGGIYDTPHLKQMAADFACEATVGIAGARRMLIQGIEDFLEDINQNERLLPHLPQFPLTQDSIFLGLAFTQNGRRTPAPYIGYAFLFDGKELCYLVQNAQGHLQTTHEESLEEAIHIIVAERQTSENQEPLLIISENTTNTIPLKGRALAEAIQREQEQLCFAVLKKEIAQWSQPPENQEPTPIIPETKEGPL